MAKTALILGAGFSKYAGIPLQSEFAEALRSAIKFAPGKPSRIIVERAESFISEVFHIGRKHSIDTWPEWEDLFTCLDLSANSGHHLGSQHDPSLLRTLRRALLARIIRMLDQCYKNATESKKMKPQQDLQKLDQFLNRIAASQPAFVSLNWDAVLERRLAKVVPGIRFNYGPHVIPAILGKKSRRHIDIDLPDQDPQQRIVSVAKMHGAGNWLYCDDCRRQFSVPPEQSGSVATQIMRPNDWKSLRWKRADVPKTGSRECPFCGVVLGTRMATFSYRKVLDSPILLKTWFFAEDILRDATNWVFVGYSLPSADFEFKYLLKRIELARSQPPRLFLVDTSQDTAKRFQLFFGDRLPTDAICLDGLGAEAINMLVKGGVVRRRR